MSANGQGNGTSNDPPSNHPASKTEGIEADDKRGTKRSLDQDEAETKLSSSDGSDTKLSATVTTGRSAAASKTTAEILMEREERRLAANRIKAKETRKRKKLMIEEMKKQIVSLSRVNDELRRKNQELQHALAVALEPRGVDQRGGQPHRPVMVENDPRAVSLQNPYGAPLGHSNEVAGQFGPPPYGAAPPPGQMPARGATSQPSIGEATAAGSTSHVGQHNHFQGAGEEVARRQQQASETMQASRNPEAEGVAPSKYGADPMLVNRTAGVTASRPTNALTSPLAHQRQDRHDASSELLPRRPHPHPDGLPLGQNPGAAMPAHFNVSQYATQPVLGHLPANPSMPQQQSIPNLAMGPASHMGHPGHLTPGQIDPSSHALGRGRPNDGMHPSQNPFAGARPPFVPQQDQRVANLDRNWAQVGGSSQDEGAKAGHQSSGSNQRAANHLDRNWAQVGGSSQDEGAKAGQESSGSNQRATNLDRNWAQVGGSSQEGEAKGDPESSSSDQKSNPEKGNPVPKKESEEV